MSASSSAAGRSAPASIAAARAGARRGTGRPPLPWPSPRAARPWLSPLRAMWVRTWPTVHPGSRLGRRAVVVVEADEPLEQDAPARPASRPGRARGGRVHHRRCVHHLRCGGAARYGPSLRPVAPGDHRGAALRQVVVPGEGEDLRHGPASAAGTSTSSPSAAEIQALVEEHPDAFEVIVWGKRERERLGAGQPRRGRPDPGAGAARGRVAVEGAQAPCSPPTTPNTRPDPARRALLPV